VRKQGSTSYLKPWLVFVLLGGLGATFGAILVSGYITSALQLTGASDKFVAGVDWIVRSVIALLISFSAFRYVVRKFFVRKSSDEGSQRI
jgi:integral membrane sensor domain MASE1